MRYVKAIPRNGGEHDEAISRLQAEYNRFQARIDTMYIDKLDGRIDAAFFDRMAAQWRDEQARCLRDIERHQTANQSYLQEGIHLMELARSAQRLFAQQDAQQKRRFLNFVVSNSSWKRGALTLILRQPFDILANAASSDTAAGDGRGAATRKSPFLDTFRTMCLAPEPEFRRLLEGIRGVGLADLSYVA